jgi:hypothetical protein
MQYEDSQTLAVPLELKRGGAVGMRTALTVLTGQINRVLATSENCHMPLVGLLVAADRPYVWTTLDRAPAHRELPRSERREAHAICAIVTAAGLADAIGQFDAETNLFRAQHQHTFTMGPASCISFETITALVRLAFCAPRYKFVPAHAAAAAATTAA